MDTQSRVVYASCADGTIQMWSPEGGQVQQVGTHNDICSHIRHAPQHGNIIISSGYDGQIKYWDPRTQQCQGNIQSQHRLIGMD